MAHFARIKNGVVQQVIVVGNNDIENRDFPDSEPIGQEFIKSIGLDGFWLQTSYNGNFRKNFAGKGFTYDSENDAFVPPRPFPSWILDENTFTWRSPTDPPNRSDIQWNEDIKDWEIEPTYEVE